jgi:hypothetical protein
MPVRLRPIVRDAHRWTTTNSNECVDLAHYPQAGQRGFGDEHQALAREVVDDRRNPKATAVAQCLRAERLRALIAGKAAPRATLSTVQGTP